MLNKKEVFIDSDVILDVCFDRKPFIRDSQQILSLAETVTIVGYTSSLILANCYYILSHQIKETAARATIAKLRSFLTVLPFTDKEISESLNSNFKDFEDGIQYFICLNHGLETFITRNVRDYKKENIAVVTPEQYLILHHAHY